MRKTALLLSMVVLTACAPRGREAITIEFSTPELSAREDYDIHQCDVMSKASAHPNAGETAKAGGTGAVIGGAVGAGGGAIAGKPEAGAAAGALAGAAVGSVVRYFAGEGEYKAALVDCLRRKGHNVIDGLSTQ